MGDIPQSFKDNTASFTGGALATFFTAAAVGGVYSLLTPSSSIVFDMNTIPGAIGLGTFVTCAAFSGLVGKKGASFFEHMFSVKDTHRLAMLAGILAGGFGAFTIMYDTQISNYEQIDTSAEPAMQAEQTPTRKDFIIDTEQPTLVARPDGKTYPALRL